MKKQTIEWAIRELEDAKGCLYEAANELLRERPADPVAPQLDSLAKQTQQAIDTLKERLKHASLPS